MKKLRIIDGLFLVGTLLGLPLGFYIMHYRFIDNEKAIGMTSQEATVDDFAKKAFLYADPRIARSALTFAIKTHQEMQTANPLWGKTEKVDLGWCYAQLSLIEESAGDTKLAREHMAQAGQILRGAGLNDATEARIRQTLQPKTVANPPSDEKLP